jgi:hypothetical protein
MKNRLLFTGIKENNPLRNVHFSNKTCSLLGCSRTFLPKRKGLRAQRFCCPEHRIEYFKKARRVGEATIDAIKDME